MARLQIAQTDSTQLQSDLTREQPSTSESELQHAAREGRSRDTAYVEHAFRRSKSDSTAVDSTVAASAVPSTKTIERVWSEVPPYATMATVLQKDQIEELPPAVSFYALDEQAVFGPYSLCATKSSFYDVPHELREVHLTDSYAYQGLVLIVFVIFCYVLNRYRTSLHMVFQMATGWLSMERTFDENALFFNRFLRLSGVWGVVVVSGILIRGADLFGPERWLPDVSWAGEAVVLAVVLAVTGVALFRYLLPKVVESVIADNLFFARLRFRNRVYSAFSNIVLTPLLLIVALADSSAIVRFMYVEAGALILLILLYLGQSYRFFMLRNVSILQWILYLCAVEIFPVSFFLLATMRNL